MKQRLFALITFIFFSTIVAVAQEQESPKTIEEMAIEEAVRLEKELKLEPHQAFYLDSILQHDMKAMDNEMQELRSAGVQDFRNFEVIREKWLEQVKSSVKKILTEEQYIQYLKEIGHYKKEKDKEKNKGSKKKKR